MPSKPKGFKHEYSYKIVLVILKLKNSGQSYFEIALYLEILKFFIITILNQEARQSDDLPKPNK